MVSDIESSDHGAFWTISFLDRIHCINEDRYLLIQKEDFPCKNIFKSTCLESRLKQSNLIRTAGGVGPLLHDGAPNYGHLVSVSFFDTNKKNIGFLTASDDEASDVDDNDDDGYDDSDDDQAIYSDLDSFSNLEDSDDLEVVFDDTIDACQWPKEVSQFLPTAKFMEISNSLDEMEDLCQEKYFPHITKECISVRVTDIINVPDKLNCDDFIGNPLKQNCERFPFPCGYSEKLSGPNMSYSKEKTHRKTVTFAVQEQLVTVHPMIKWNFAYRNARKGPWERYACDRFHFQSRIQSCEHVLGPMLERKYHQYLNSIV